MIDTPQIVQVGPKLVAAIHVTVPRSEIQTVMGPGLQELMAVVKAQGAGPVGPWFTHHLRMDPATFDFAICVPVAEPVSAAGRVECRELPGVRAARTIYHGPYEGLGAAWGEFGGWMAANGHEPGPDLYECYLAGPESSSNPADWRTELSRPLVGS